MWNEVDLGGNDEIEEIEVLPSREGSLWKPLIVSYPNFIFTPIKGLYHLYVKARVRTGNSHLLRLFNSTQGIMVETGSPNFLGYLPERPSDAIPVILHCQFAANGTDRYMIEYYVQGSSPNDNIPSLCERFEIVAIS